MSRTLFNTLAASARSRQDALAWDMDGVTLHYGEWLAQAEALALGLIERCALAPGAPVGLLAENCPAWLIASLAIQAAGAVEFPLGSEQEEAVLSDFFLRTNCRVCFVQDLALVERVQGLGLPWQASLCLIVLGKAESDPLETVATSGQAKANGLVMHWSKLRQAELNNTELNNSELNYSALNKQDERSPTLAQQRIHERQQAIAEQDVAVVLRSSGTTGPAKSVMLSHANFLHNMVHVAKRAELSPQDVLLCCLPLWHLYGRLVAWTALAGGARLAFRPLEDLGNALQEVQPTFFPSFPLVWIQIYHRLMDRVDSQPLLLQTLFRLCLNLSRLYFRELYRATRHDLCLQPRSRLQSITIRGWAEISLAMLAGPQWLIQKLIFRPVRKQLGGRLRAAIIGDEPLPPHIDLTLRALGLRVLEGYGSSEQMIVAMRGLHSNVTGTVGKVLPEVDLTLLDECSREVPRGAIGEIAVAGPTVFPGYYREPERTRMAFLNRSGRPLYLTGDLGRIDFHDNLLVVGRRAARIALPDGLALYPELTESVLRATRYIACAMVFPAPQAPLLALLVPEFETLYHFHHRHCGCHHGAVLLTFPREEQALDKYLQEQQPQIRHLLECAVVVHLIASELRRFLKYVKLPQHQIPTHFAMSPNLFVRGRELTPTLKLRRELIMKHYADCRPRHTLTAT
jgi:long-chain acyl-CoA synthetase